MVAVFDPAVEVRRALKSDLPAILAQLRSFSQLYTTKIKLFSDDISYMETQLQAIIANHLFLVAVKGEEVVGLIAGLVTNHFFNPKIRTLTELFWWVPPEHRGGRAGYLLFKQFTEWGEENVDWITIALEENTPVSEDALTKRGFKLLERSFLKEIH